MNRPSNIALLLLLTAALHGALAETGPAVRAGPFTLTDDDRRYWAFQPVRRPQPPAIASQPSSVHPIDAFLLAELETRGLTMNPPATPRERVRRAAFDLTGLPPSPEDVAAFERGPTEAAWDRLLDRLLASSHYGERWGRHWLDLVRYAESNGYERDGEKPNAWRYRDYVIRSFNEDKPYDQFAREQLAGDEIANELLARDGHGAEGWQDAVIATGFFRLHVWDDEPDSTVAAEYDDLDDVLVTTGAAFLGLTIGCARCHDHKYDPISQSDYYALLAFLRGIDPYGLHKTGGGGRGTGRIQRALVSKSEQERWEAEKAGRIRHAEQRLASAGNPEEKSRLEAALKRTREEAPPFPFALAVAENGPQPKPTHVLIRGDAQSPGEEVSPAFPVVLGLPSPEWPPRSADAATSGRRTALADWIASPDNPLTARVMANRIWQRHFGAGLVSTPDDFGRTGAPPTHPELLDYLASELVAGGWRLKRMHKLIMTSRAYRMSSTTRNPDAAAIDESNTWLWRQNLRRIEAESVRDTMLAVSGRLNPKAGGPSVFPTLPPEVHRTQDAAGKGWSDSPEEERNRRSVYLVVKRALRIPLLDCLDFANSTSPAGVRPVTTTAPQALMLLNDAFIQSQAAALADRVAREAGPSPELRVERAFALVLQRAPSGHEREAARALMADQARRGAEAGVTDPDRLALESLCRGMLNLNEMIYVD